MIISLRRIFDSGWTSFKRNKGSALATIFVMVLTIIFFSSIFLLKDISRSLILSIKEKADISIYFNEDSNQEDILNIKEEISNISDLTSIRYISKEQALENFIERHRDDLLLMESLNELGVNPFLSSLSIKASELSEYDAVMSFLSESSEFDDIIEKVDYHQRKPMIEKIFSLTSFIDKSSLILSFILIFISLLVSFNTIKTTISNKKEEIYLMRLVGASNWFIRGPFLIQGAICGFIASLISIIVFSTSCYFLTPKLEVLFSDVSIFAFFMSNFWNLILLQFLVGITLGIFSSLIAIRKYLKI